MMMMMIHNKRLPGKMYMMISILGATLMFLQQKSNDVICHLALLKQGGFQDDPVEQVIPGTWYGTCSVAYLDLHMRTYSPLILMFLVVLSRNHPRKRSRISRRGMSHLALLLLGSSSDGEDDTRYPPGVIIITIIIKRRKRKVC
jgi:hypothetical protein